jgi:eukaryotic-like serine/threonine-protein kinase
VVAPKVQPLAKRALLVPGVVVDHYEIIRGIGSGGMGEVFLARDLKLGRLVALKVLHPAQGADASRILVEARATAKCRHENIVVIHDMNEFEGMPYLVLEYLEGKSLRKYYKDDTLSMPRALELFCGVLRALDHAHQNGIIHRDLKPDNVFVTTTGVPKVLDFGIAKLHGSPNVQGAMGVMPSKGHGDDDDSETYVTFSGKGPVGTWSYMSPEQFSGTDVDHRTDLWALGIMMFKLVTGRHPFGKVEPAALMYMVGNADPMPSVLDFTPDCDLSLAAVIDRCLRKNRDERFPDARTMLAALEPLAVGRAAPSFSERCPYLGLQAFDEADAERFFGRAGEVSRAVARIDQQPLMAIVGPSGAGKSSFVRAGLVPELKRTRSWDAIVVRPGRAPLDVLGRVIAELAGRADADMVRAAAAQLAAEPGYLGQVLRWRAQTARCRVLLYVDQLEELYTLVAEPQLRAAFVATLRAAADDPSSPVRVVVSIRSDFLDRVAENRSFMDAVTEGLHYLMPLGRDGLRDALVRPLQLAGHGFEAAGLVDRMIDDIANADGALPLLQFAAAQMWEARDRDRRILTAASYDAMGGIAGTLAAHADRVLADMPFERRQLCQAVFRRLVTADGTRAIVDYDELVAIAPAEVPGLIAALVAARLLVSSTDQRASATVELVHESLITAWPQLRQWMEQGRDEAAFLAQLRQAAQQWEGRGKPPGLLWRGEMADEARRFASRLGGTFGSRERAFVYAVLTLANRASRIRRIAALAAIIGLAVLVVVAGVVVVEIRSAEQRAVSEAGAAQEAQNKLAEQLRVVEEKEAERAKAEDAAKLAAQQANVANSDAAQSREELQQANVKLQQALADSQQEAAKEQAAHAEVQKLLQEEQARYNQLKAQKSKIATELH